jgi:hypothetical protein
MTDFQKQEHDFVEKARETVTSRASPLALKRQSENL